MIRKLRSAMKQSLLLVVLAGPAIACAGAPAADGDAESANAEAAEPVAQQPAQTQSAEVSCEMTFTMEGWSAVVSKAEGEGTVTCDNGQTAEVALEVDGAGLTFGKTEIDEGKGTFTEVTDISEIFGSYAQAEASAGAVEAVSAQALTKGEVSLAITTQGRGWSLGVSGAKFNIERADNAGNTNMDA
jgi:hypothetical protein